MKLNIKRTQLLSMKGKDIPFYTEDETKDILKEAQKKNISKLFKMKSNSIQRTLKIELLKQFISGEELRRQSAKNLLKKP